MLKYFTKKPTNRTFKRVLSTQYTPIIYVTPFLSVNL